MAALDANAIPRRSPFCSGSRSPTSSHQAEDSAFPAIRKIHRHSWELSLGLYEELKAVLDVQGTLWDNTRIGRWNELGQRNVHSIKDQLVVLVGGAQGYFRRGRLLDFDNAASFSDLLVTCFHFMAFEDVQVFGDPRLSLGPISGLT